MDRKTKQNLLDEADKLADFTEIMGTFIDENIIKWSLYIPAFIVGAVGVAAIRIDDNRHKKTEHHVTSRIETVFSSLEKIVANIKKLNADKHSVDTYDMRHRIDEMFIEDLETFVEARESIIHRYGLSVYGDVMSSFAAGDRYLNRVWSASADGYIDEINVYLDKAQEQFIHSHQKLQFLVNNPKVS